MLPVFVPSPLVDRVSSKILRFYKWIITPSGGDVILWHRFLFIRGNRDDETPPNCLIPDYAMAKAEEDRVIKS